MFLCIPIVTVPLSILNCIFRATQFFFHSQFGARSPRVRCEQGHVLAKALVEKLFPCLLSLPAPGRPKYSLGFSSTNHIFIGLFCAVSIFMWPFRNSESFVI